MPITPGTRLGRYVISSRLGAGGMGEVYLAEDTDLNRRVALKLLLTSVTENPDHLRRFKQEARAASALNHPNILTIHEIGKTDSGNFIVTEFIEGVTLRQLISSGKLTPVQMCDVAIQVASALSAAHEAGIVHRDIKPDNIMLRHDGYVKVLDFGIAKLIERPKFDPEGSTLELVDTGPGNVMGTPEYMSPEQARGQEMDARTDIWSLGIVLYEMAAGHGPFRGASTNDVVAAILKVEPPRLRHEAPDVSPELERIIYKALHKDRDLRYQKIGDLLIDLQLLRQTAGFSSGLDQYGPPVSRPSVGGPPGGGAVGSYAETIRNSANIKVRPRITAGQQAAREAIESLAILPLVNASSDPNSEYLSDGITETIINKLSQVTNLRVMARSTVFRYKGQDVDPLVVARELKVRAVVTGRVLQLGSNLIIKAELVDSKDGSQLWGEQYNRQPSDILLVQEEIAREITQSLQLKLSGEQQEQLKKRHTDNPKAYQLYLKARYFWNKRTEAGIKKCIGFFNQAIEEDPCYAMAYVGLSDGYDMLGVYNILSPQEALSRAKAAAERALEIDGTLAEAHTSLAKVRSDYDWDWVASEAEFKRAINLNPKYAPAHQWYALYLMAMERFAEAQAQIVLAHELEPLSPSISVSVGLPYYWSRKYEDAIKQFTKAIELDRSFYLTHVLLGQTYVQVGAYEKAINELQAARELDDTPHIEAVLGYAYAVSGQTAEADQVLGDLDELAQRRYVSPYFRALVHVGLGDVQKAFHWLNVAYEERNGWLVWLKVDPKLDTLRSDPRFPDLLRRVGFSPEPVAGM